MMPAQPVATFKMVQTQFVFELAVVKLYSPSRSSYPDEVPYSRRTRPQLGKPIFDRRCFIHTPFNQQPLGHPLNRILGLPPVGCPYFDLGIARSLGSLGALSPRYGVPCRSRQLLRHCKQILRSRKALQWGA